jgi:hypothetical protein
VVGGLSLEWGSVAGDLLRADGATFTLDRRLRGAATAWIREAPPGADRAERAVQVALEVARLLGPAVRLRAQMLLETLSEQEQERALREGGRDAPPLSGSVGRLLALIASGMA